MMTRSRLLLLITFPALAMIAGCNYSSPVSEGPQAAQVGEYVTGEDPEYGALKQLGERIQLRAVVRDYIPNALQIGKEGGVAIFQPGTVIQIISPGKFFGKELVVHHPTERAPQSVWRDSTAQMTIEVDSVQLGPDPSVLYEQEVEVLSIDKSTDGVSARMGTVMGS